MNRISANPAVTSGLSPRSYGINFANTNPIAAGLPSIVVSGFFGGGNAALGDAQQPFVDRVNHVWQLADDLTWITGRHSLKFGADVRREAMRIAFINRPNGDLTFSGGLSGNAAADFLLGFPAQARATTQQAIQEGYGWLFAGYAQDEFRITSRLTLNLGVRYELPTPFIDVNDAITGFRTGVQSQKYPGRAPRARLSRRSRCAARRGADRQEQRRAAPGGRVGSERRRPHQHPLRLRRVLRCARRTGRLLPERRAVAAVHAVDRAQHADADHAGGSARRRRRPAESVSGGADDHRLGRRFQVAVRVPLQRRRAAAVVRRVGTEVSYVGSRGHNLPIFMEINPGVYAPGQTARGARLMPAFALVRPTFPVAKSWYDSLQASVRMLPTRGLNFLASYTLGKTTDHVSGLNIGGEARPVLPVVQGDEASIARALEFEKGPALFDARHRFVVSFGYELPALENSAALVRAIGGGWQLNGIYQAQTGFPLTVTQGTVLDIRYMTSRPDVTCDPNDGPKTTAQWFNTSCFTTLTLAQTGERPGNAGRNTVRGPGFQRTDLSVFKNFTFAARHRIQIRIEGFNIFNQARFGQPNGTIGTAPFGQITSAEDGRIVQLGLKYTF